MAVVMAPSNDTEELRRASSKILKIIAVAVVALGLLAPPAAVPNNPVTNTVNSVIDLVVPDAVQDAVVGNVGAEPAAAWGWTPPKWVQCTAAIAALIGAGGAAALYIASLGGPSAAFALFWGAKIGTDVFIVLTSYGAAVGLITGVSLACGS